MKHRLFTAVAILVLATNYAVSQKIVPTVEWQASFGGTELNTLEGMVGTSDQGYLLGGTSRSDISGNKTTAGYGGSDFWVIKIDANGQKLWDATFGGSGDDNLATLLPSTDGGFLLGGYTTSPASGNKASPSFDGRPISSGDFWIVKIDSSGQRQWDAAYGGYSTDDLFSVCHSPTGGYLLGGHSVSWPGGNKQAPRIGDGDGWLVKITDNGEKQWDAAVGGLLNDCVTHLQPTKDGDYLLGGYSRSHPSGTKMSAGFGHTDFWLVKANALGETAWDVSFGGSSDEAVACVIESQNDSYILGGTSWSNASGNKNTSAFGLGDFWLVKVDGNGKKEWDRAFGGSGSENLTSLLKCADGGVLAAGSSDSRKLSGNKGALTFGDADYWMVKVDAHGNKVWDSALGGSDNDSLTSMLICPDSGYLLGGNSRSPASGTRESQISLADIWIVKLEGDLILNRASRVISWENGADTVLESAPELTGEWAQFNGDRLNVSGFQALSLESVVGTRFYRLRRSDYENTPANVPTLEIGNLLTWPKSASALLETSTSGAGPWVAFKGMQGQIDDQIAAVIPQDQTQNYFRTRKAD